MFSKSMTFSPSLNRSSRSGQRSKKTEFNAEVEGAQITQGRKELNMFEKGERSAKLQLGGEHCVARNEAEVVQRI